MIPMIAGHYCTISICPGGELHTRPTLQYASSMHLSHDVNVSSTPETSDSMLRCESKVGVGIAEIK